LVAGHKPIALIRVHQDHPRGNHYLVWWHAQACLDREGPTSHGMWRCSHSRKQTL
jgi:hypothetical protein